MSGIDDGLAGNGCDTTTTGTTSMLSLIASSARSIGPLPSPDGHRAVTYAPGYVYLRSFFIMASAPEMKKVASRSEVDRYVQPLDSSVLYSDQAGSTLGELARKPGGQASGPVINR